MLLFIFGLIVKVLILEKTDLGIQLYEDRKSQENQLLCAKEILRNYLKKIKFLNESFSQ